MEVSEHNQNHVPWNFTLGEANSSMDSIDPAYNICIQPPSELLEQEQQIKGKVLWPETLQ